MNIPGAYPLSDDDRVALGKFLNSPLGVAYRRAKLAGRPKIKDNPDVAHGWEKCCEFDEQFADPEESQSSIDNFQTL